MERVDQQRLADGSPSPTIPDGGGSALLLAPSSAACCDRTCVQLSMPSSRHETDFLGVSLEETVDQVLDRWQRHAGGPPARSAVVTAEDTMRSAAAASGGQPAPVGSNVRTASVSSPTDLTGLGIKTSQVLSAWESEPNDLVVCFRSLTTLLQSTDVKHVFRFLHVLTQRVKTTGAVAHFHMDSETHDDKTVATLRGLFDSVYELDDGTWTEY